MELRKEKPSPGFFKHVLHGLRAECRTDQRLYRDVLANMLPTVPTPRSTKLALFAVIQSTATSTSVRILTIDLQCNVFLSQMSVFV